MKSTMFEAEMVCIRSCDARMAPLSTRTGVGAKMDSMELEREKVRPWQASQ